MTFSLLLLVACGGEITLQPGQDGCTDYNFEAPQETTIEFDVSSDGSGRVWRTYAVQDQAGLLFDPVIEVSGKQVDIFEAWSGGESEDAFCYSPYVTFSGLTGTMTVNWFLEEGDEIAWDTVEITAK